MASTRTQLATLENLLTEADLILSTTELPEGRAVRFRELLCSALALTDDLLSSAKLPAAALRQPNAAATTPANFPPSGKRPQAA